MRIKYAHLCDFAAVGENLKPSLMGIFDMIRWPTAFPCVLPLPITLFANIVVEPHDEGVKVVTITTHDPDMRELKRVEYAIDIDGGGTRMRDFNITHQILSARFDVPGHHLFVVKTEVSQIEVPIVVLEGADGQNP